MKHRRAALLYRLTVLTIFTPALIGQTQTTGNPSSTGTSLYPLAAKAAGIEGKVVLRGVIGTDGKMRDLHVVKGRDELRQAAIDTVMRWVYQPYSRNGIPVEVLNAVTVNFSLGSSKEEKKGGSGQSPC